MKPITTAQGSAYLTKGRKTRRVAGGWLGATLAASLLLVSACAPQSFSEEQRTERALQFEAAGELRAAEIEWRNLLQENPSHGEARLRLGLLNLEMGQLSTARWELRRAADLGQPAVAVGPPLARIAQIEGEYQRVLDVLEPRDFENADVNLQTEVLLLRGEALAALDRLGEASASTNQALALAPEHAPAQVLMASLELAQGREDEARARLQATLAGQPEEGRQGWSVLGDLERGAGNLADAEKAYARAVEHFPDSFSLRMKRALTRLAQGDLDGLEQDLAAMERLGPKEPTTTYIRGMVNFQRERYPEAQSAFEEFLSGAPAHQQARFFLGATLFAQGDARRAELHLEHLLRENPNSLETARLLAQVHMSQGHSDRAETLLRRVLASNPDDGEALSLMSAVHLERGDSAAAVDQLQRLASLQPEDPAPRASLADLLMRAGEREQALGELRAAIERAPDDSGLLISLAVELLQGGEFDSALAELETLRADQPGEPLPRTLTAAGYIGKGELGRAREFLLEALEVAPGNPAASLTLAQLSLQAGDTEAARRQLEESLAHHSGDPRVSLRLAQLEAEAGNLDAMQTVLERSIERHPEELAPRVVLARYHLGRDEPRRALTLLEPVLEGPASENPEVLEVLANAQIAAGLRAEAVTTTRSLAKYAPDSADTRFGLGNIFERAGSPADARGEYMAALELEPNHPLSLQSLGALELREGRIDEAMELARRMQGSAGIAGPGYLLEGRAHTAAGRHNEAVSALHAAYELTPSPETAVTLGLALQQTDRTPEAADMLQARLAQHPDETAVRLVLAQALLSIGDNPGAIREYEELVRTLPEHVAVLNNLAYLYQTQGDARALDFAERAYEQAPNNPSVADTLGWILVQRGEVSRGLPLLETAHQALPDLPNVRYHYAFALAQSGQKQDALRELRELLEIFDAFPRREDALRLEEELRR